MKIAALVLALLFTLFAAFQYNDPDTWLWVMIYGLAALLSFLFYRGVRSIILYATAMIAYLLGAIYLWPPVYKGLTLSMDYALEIEEARESLGLGICALAMVFYLVSSYRKSYPQRR